MTPTKEKGGHWDEEKWEQEAVKIGRKDTRSDEGRAKKRPGRSKTKTTGEDKRFQNNFN